MIPGRLLLSRVSGAIADHRSQSAPQAARLRSQQAYVRFPPIADISSPCKVGYKVSVDVKLRHRLIALAQRDGEIRQRLASDGTLFDGYHPEMQAVHEENASVLESLVRKHGWPDADSAGQDGAEAAWLIAQHAIGCPDFQRLCLCYLQAAAADEKVPPWQPAMLLDRIRVFEGRRQVYGTSFDWNEAGEMSPLPIENPDLVDARRAEVGLPPLGEALERHRKQSENEPKPANIQQRLNEMEAWAKRVGWR